MASTIARSDLLDGLESLADRIGDPPTRDQMNEVGPFSQTPYYETFGSWGDALEAAGLDKTTSPK